MLRLEGRANANSVQIPCRHPRWTVALWAAVIAALALSSLTPPNAVGAAEGEQPYRVKVAFLFNFASLVKWPEESFKDSESPFVVCHYGGSQTTVIFDTA